MCWRKIRTQREWKVQMVGRESEALASGVWDLGMSLWMRSCISRAALLVKVTARMLAGGTPLAMRWAMRNVMTRVLPVPAPARISSGPLRVSTAWRCWGLSEFRFNTRAEFNFHPAQCNVVDDFYAGEIETSRLQRGHGIWSVVVAHLFVGVGLFVILLLA